MITHATRYTFQHLEPKDMTTLDWDGGGTAEHTVSFSNNCGASNTGSTCSVYTAIQYVYPGTDVVCGLC